MHRAPGIASLMSMGHRCSRSPSMLVSFFFLLMELRCNHHHQKQMKTNQCLQPRMEMSKSSHSTFDSITNCCRKKGVWLCEATQKKMISPTRMRSLDCLAHLMEQNNNILQPRIASKRHYTRSSTERMRLFEAMKEVFSLNDVTSVILSFMGIEQAVNLVQTCKTFRTLPPMYAHLEKLILCFDEKLSEANELCTALEEEMRRAQSEEEMEETSDRLLKSWQKKVRIYNMKKRAAHTQVSILEFAMKSVSTV